MSTEHQQYSIEIQIANIALYAEQHNLAIVETYRDEAKSGLLLKNRPGLRQLLADVVQGDCPFKAVLVYDVSRFGRFQDTDEAAHWEFVCKSAGAPIHYCAETFVNDNSLISALMKSLKRVMAGEYSRDLSMKTYEGQKRLSMLGFTMGGHPGYGLARVLLSDTGATKQVLQHGELKSIQKDRVTLAPGRPEEVACVREIYRMFVEKRMGATRIVRELNARNIPSPTSGIWRRSAVRRILCNPKYSGSMVYGKRSWKLGSNPTTLPSHEWIVTPGAFEPIIDLRTFQKAQQLRKSLTVHRTNEDMLMSLQKLIAERGNGFKLRDLDKLADFPNLRTYQDRFGGTRHLYELLGYEYLDSLRRVETYHRIRQLRKDLMEQIVEADPVHFALCIPKCGKAYLEMNGRGSVGVFACRRSVAPHHRTHQWSMYMSPFHTNPYFLLALLNQSNTVVDKLILVRGFAFRYRMVNVFPKGALLKEAIVLNGVGDLYSAVDRLQKPLGTT
jgi:DNA invertase Pin-like site-specific DNA recombinase